MKRTILWLLAIVFTGALTLAVFFPATWVAALVEKQTGGRLTLGDAQGTLWRGSAFVGGAASGNGPVTPLLPGRFAWRLSPLALIGNVRMELSNPESLTQSVVFTGSWREWQLSPAALRLPADGLSGLGAPLNTLALSGRLQLAWTSLQLALVDRNVQVRGVTTLRMDDVSSRLAPTKPLGSYQLALDWQGQHANVVLTTAKGPLLLSGTGQLRNGRLQFSGQADTATGYEDTLGNLINLLGQRRNVGGKNIIALEFR
ncbi:general secretion pathway protein N [Pseudoduganella flava]|uniref:Type II secretion system protein N n=1 Tax=Pseudoduganella flava TaxID=871742 RepID=A0A562PNY9_9BURK|nr:type II secretion system protein N [Pseudoduganella flava]QGZ40690.1 type II secretion system protein GspN [Pseudoduganella flava]TWI46144.1 general secretion pathway protein N [Pseudoduganella flava]